MTPTRRPSSGSATTDIAAEDPAPRHGGSGTARRAPLLTDAPSEGPAGSSDSFDALVEEIRRRYYSNTWLLWDRLAEVIRRRLDLSPRSTAAAAAAGLLGTGLRLALALLATAMAGQWTGIPWGRWMVILLVLGLLDALDSWMTPQPDVSLGQRFSRYFEEWTPLLPTIRQEADLRQLAEFTRHLIRLPLAMAVGVGVAAGMLVASWIVAPAAMSELPAGTIVVLALLLYEFGTHSIYWGNLVNWALMSREARYDHELFWPNPAHSPEVQKAMRKTAVQGSAAGASITLFLVATVVLVSWESPTVLPLGAGFILIGYLSNIGAALGSRAAVRTIVERARLERLQGLQRRIRAFGPRYTDLTPQESDQLRDLLDLHDRIWATPSTPTTTHTLLRTTAGLIVPTITFIITVFGEVSAERILDAVLH